jgi:hypothetical protein
MNLLINYKNHGRRELGRPRKKQRDQLLAKHFLSLSEAEKEEEKRRNNKS